MSAIDASPRSALHRLRDFRLYLHNPSFLNPAWETAPFRALIMRLSPFSDVERSTPHLFLAGEIRRACPDAYVDMAFLPDRDDIQALEEARLPLILGTQSHRPLQEFDLVLVSNAYLLELVNLPFLFSRSGVPLWSRQRDEKWPPVILGGSNATAAHAILRHDGDCMVDAIFFGEGEESVARITRELCRPLDIPGKLRLAAMAREIEGLWAPSVPAREVRRSVCDPGRVSLPGPAQPVLPGAEAVTARLSITLGCPCLCSFCYEGHDRRPFREIPAEALILKARRLKEETGASTLEVSSFNFNTHSELPKLLLSFQSIFLRVNLMSQRADILARTPGLLDLEIASDKHSFTLGIEGISARLRRFLHKSLADSDITGALEALHGKKTREVKLFYMITGRENDADFAELARFMKWLKEMRRAARSTPRVVFSFGILVRMPFTPLRYDPPLFFEAAGRPLAGKARSICETNGFEFRLSHSWPEYAATQALALGDSTVADLVLRMADRGPVTRDGLPWGAEEDVQEWVKGRSPSLLAEKPRDHAFAFPQLETESSRKSLYRQYLAAKAGRDGGNSDGPPGARRSGIPSQSVRALEEITAKKRKLAPLFMKTMFPEETAGLGTAWKESWLMRRLIALNPGQIDNVLAVRESLFSPSNTLGEDTSWFGLSVAAITAWDAPSFAAAVQNVPGLFLGEAPGFIPGSCPSLRIRVALPARPFPRPGGSTGRIPQGHPRAGDSQENLGRISARCAGKSAEKEGHSGRHGGEDPQRRPHGASRGSKAAPG